MVDRENLVRKIQFPRLVIPLSVVLTAYFNLLLNLVAVLIFVLAAGVEPRWSWLELPAARRAARLFATGMAMLLSALFVRFRDVRPIWEVVLQVALLRLAGHLLDRAAGRPPPGRHTAPAPVHVNPLAASSSRSATR